MKSFFDQFAKLKRNEIAAIDEVIAKENSQQSSTQHCETQRNAKKRFEFKKRDTDTIAEDRLNSRLTQEQKKLKENPKIIYQSWWRVAGESAVVILFFFLSQSLVLILAGAYATLQGTDFADMGIFLISVNSFLTLLTLLGIGFVFLKRFRSYCTINHRCIKCRRGVFFAREQVITFEQTRSCEIRRTVIGKLLNIGTVVVRDPFIDELLFMRSIPAPDEVQNLIKQTDPLDISKKDSL